MHDVNDNRIDQFEGIYRYFYDTLATSNFISNYLAGGNNTFINYLSNPDKNALELIKELSDKHDKSAPVLSAIGAMSFIENSMGTLTEKHRLHVVHSINVLLLGICLIEKHPKLKRFLYCYPGERIGQNGCDDSHSDTRAEAFYFRWVFACIFHDIGYIFELMARGLDPDGMSINWTGIEELRRGIGRIKINIQETLARYIRELRHMPIIPFKQGLDDVGPNQFRENHGHRKVKEETDILELFAYLIHKSGIVPGNTHQLYDSKAKVFQELESTLDTSYKIGVDKSFDHGKLAAFIFLHEIRTSYLIGRNNPDRSMSIAWHRANFYFDLMDSALAIYLHNALRFQLDSQWGPYTPRNIPPLSYLLTLCDLLVEWDKAPVGFGYTNQSIDAKHISIQSDPDNAITATYHGNRRIASDVNERIQTMFDQNFICIQANDG